ncbi:MAG: CRISPR-associated protein Cas4 [Candidatus Thorarchaeota archaeon]|nr:CRISPR-associated protein Cas4 [Candidatus Thorarchaeota archaeon]
MTSSCEVIRTGDTADDWSVALERLNGTMVNYYVVCKRKLWLFSRNLGREQDSELVTIGKLIHESSFKRREKEELILGRVKIDHTTRSGRLIVHEVKKSRSHPEAARAQLHFYIWFLERLGVTCEGQLHFYGEKQREDVSLGPSERAYLEAIILDALRTIDSPSSPECQRSALCRKCAYRDYCWA